MQRPARAGQLSSQLILKTGITQLIGEALAAQGAEPQFVVNNAGFGLGGPASARDRNEQLEMIDLNVRVLTELSLAFVDSLARHRGGLLNVGSMAGFLPGPGMAVYYATKAYVLSFTEASSLSLGECGLQCYARARCRANSPIVLASLAA